MKLPPFTLVQPNRSKAAARGLREPGSLKKDLLELSELLTKGSSSESHAQGGAEDRGRTGLSSFNTGLQRTLASSLRRRVLSASDVSLVADDLNHSRKSKAVGIWDLRSWVGGLPNIIEHLNRAQSALTFFEVQAAIPSGLVQDAERVAFRATQMLHRKLKPTEKREMRDAIVDVDFFPSANQVRKTLGVDYLIALTSAAIAGAVDDKAGHTFHADYFSSYEKNVCLASTLGLREFAEKAARPFEMAAAYVAITSLLAAMNPKIDMHDWSVGCLFDYNYDRSKIVLGLQKPSIEDGCLKLLRAENRETAQLLVRALADYQPPGKQTTKPTQPRKKALAS
jgi:hypothetical protein